MSVDITSSRKPSLTPTPRPTSSAPFQQLGTQLTLGWNRHFLVSPNCTASSLRAGQGSSPSPPGLVKHSAPRRGWTLHCGAAPGEKGVAEGPGTAPGNSSVSWWIPFTLRHHVAAPSGDSVSSLLVTHVIYLFRIPFLEVIF